MNRFLLRESYDQFDLFNEVKQYIELIGGTLSIDDTVIEKLYSNPNLSEFFSSLRAFIKLELMRYKELIDNWYQLQREISLQVNRHFI